RAGAGAATRGGATPGEEARQLAGLYGAAPAKIWTINPGVDLSVFRPGPPGDARRRLGLPAEGRVIVFAGRIQPLKAPDVVLHAAAELIRAHPALAQTLTVAFVGGPSGTGRADPDQLTAASHAPPLPDLLPGASHAVGIGGVVRVEPPCPQSELADWYRAATVVMVPSYSESFGLVAVEAQACGTPVIAASVGGLRTAVQDGVSGILVEGHD